MSTNYTIALAGNPNVGKSTIYNSLTGTRQHVGNWPGKTVEKKEGKARIKDREITVVDLPGTYSLTAYSIEEIIARDFIVNEHPDAVVAVVDASNLERNLYLVAQLLELEVPFIVALNMSDTAQNQGLKIDPQTLSERLGGVTVVKTVGNRSIGFEALKKAIFELTSKPPPSAFVNIDYGATLENEIATLQARITEDAALRQEYNPRWLAIKLLEADEEVYTKLQAAGHTALISTAERAADSIAEATGEDAETLIADRRYLFISDVVGSAVVRPSVMVETRSDKIDKIITHRLWGLPIFLLLMWIIFQFTANVSAPFLDWVDGVIGGPITNWTAAILEVLGLNGTWIESLAVDGIIAGVGGVLVFVPVLLFLYFSIAILEDSGYMARAAFVMDRVMRAMGLHGKSFLPMLVGFGCTVPAIYATRTLENEDDRKLTGFLTTFMSCGARLPVYAVFGTAFFGTGGGNLIFAMYVLGIIVALLTGLVMKRTVYRNTPPAPFVLELPPYRMPTAKSVALQMWERVGGFLRKATTIIMAVAIILWFLLAIPATTDAGEFNDIRAEDSLFGTVSSAIAPIFAPAGFGDWQAAGSLITGFIAKEVVIGTMNQIYVDEAVGDMGAAAETEGAEEEVMPTFGEDVGEMLMTFGEAAVLTVQETVNIVPRTVNIIPGVGMAEADFLGAEEDDEDNTRLEGALTNAFTPLAAVAFNVFVLLYVPCMVAVAAMRHEFGTRWMLYQAGYTTVLAWVAAVIVYQGGLLLGLG